MSAPSFPSYLEELQRVWHSATLDSRVVSHTLHIDQGSQLRGYVRAQMELVDGSEFHLREYVDVTSVEPRVMYAYHYQDQTGQLIFRYDNALHRPPLPRPEHKHIGDTVVTGPTPTLQAVLDELFDYLDRLTG